MYFVIAFALTKLPVIISLAFIAPAIPCVPQLVVCTTIFPEKSTFSICEGELP